MVELNSKIWVQFSLTTEAGDLIDSCFDQEPAEMIIGDGNMMPGFEKAMLGMNEGEQSVFRIAAEDAFGLHNEDNVHFFALDQFEEQSLEVGLVMNFSDPASGELPGVISAIEDERVTVDFNHPLAGMDILFDVKIHRIECVAQ